MSHTPDLFSEPGVTPRWQESLAPGATILRGFAIDHAARLAQALRMIEAKAAFRHMITPGGHRMRVAMTNCGPLGWITDRSGYRYTDYDPLTGRAWPAMPPVFRQLAVDAAKAAGFDHFVPDACLINRYAPGAGLSLHQDKNERDFDHPIVSVSLGVSATFLFGGWSRGERPLRIQITHGDVVVWGGPARLRYHGIAPLKSADHPFAGPHRINLTFRRAGPAVR